MNKKESVACLYLNGNWNEKETGETIPFTITSNDMKYLGVTLTKQAKDLYDKNFKTLKNK